MLIGLDAFFNVEDDKIINWKEFFHLTDDEQFYTANNNQIIEAFVKFVKIREIDKTVIRENS